MILDLNYVFEKYSPKVSGIIHIGGHYGNEIEKYKSHNVNNIVLFEPLSSNFSVLSEKIRQVGCNITAHQVALGNDNRRVVMNISSNEAQSSSILTPKVHLTAHPEVSFDGTEEVQMKKLDDYNYQTYNMMVIDVQGYELEVLKGASKTLDNVDYIYCEVNRDEVYEGNARVEEIDEYLSSYGFERVETQWYYTEVWGDAFYIKNKKSYGNVSIICACKNRYNSLKLSLNSWLMFDAIKEVIIVDWSSDDSIDDLLSLDERVRIIRVNGQKYFNLSQPLNLAASFVTGDYILKMDCDYLINPYFNFLEDYVVDENSFLSGNPTYKSPEFMEDGLSKVDFTGMEYTDIADYVNTYSHYYKYLKGLLFVSTKNFQKIGGFNEDIQSYGWDDGEIIVRLEKLNLIHKKMNYDYRVMHLPHPDKKRIEHSKDYNITDENYFTDTMRGQYSEDSLPFQVDYALVAHYTELNKTRLLESGVLGDNSEHYVKPKTIWNISELGVNYYLAEEKNMINDKLKGIPSVYYVTLDESIDRQKELQNQFLNYHIIPKSIKSKRFSESDDKVSGKYLNTLNDGTKGCCVSHLKAIKQWYENSNDDYGFFCEDDLSLETVEFWNFTWDDFIEKIPEDAECVQLFTIRDNYNTFELRERYWDDWGVTAYIITRDYAKKIIDTFIKDDCYNLEIPDQDIMPLIENILFASVGKTYTIPLFVENIKFNSTFVGYDDDVKDGHKKNHKISRDLVLNYWKNNFNNSIKQKTELENLLTSYSLDTENAEHNFNLGLWYEKEGHTAPALSYYLRCSERSENEDLAYEALIRGSYCYEKQGERDGSSRSLLWQAQAFRPDRPEAYFLLSRYAERREWWQDCYMNADLALRYCNFDCNSLRTNVEYPGKCGLLYEKAVSGWWWGKTEESKSLLLGLLEEYQLPENDKNIIKEKLKSWGVETH